MFKPSFRFTPHLMLVPVLLALGACGQLPRQSSTDGGFSSIQDAGPTGAVDLSQVREPVPHALAKSKYGNPASYEVFGKTYRVMSSAVGYSEKGIASWYGTKFHGRRTSSGEPYDMYQYSAAHKTLPIPVFARVTNLENGESIVVRINDRGPFHEDRIIDLSYAAAHRLGIAARGTGLVQVTVLTGAEAATVTAAAKTQQEAGVQVQSRAVSARPAAQKPVALSAPLPLEPLAPVVTPPTGTAAAKPAPTAVAAATPVTGNAAPQLYLQIGAFSQQDNAARLREQLSGAGFTAVEVAIPGRLRSDELYRVVLGPLHDVEETDRLAQRLRDTGFDHTRVIVE